MSEYQGCDKCKHVGSLSGDFPCRECVHNRAVDHFKPKTNADRIRNMTDEELAEFLEGFTVCKHCEYDRNGRCTLENPCVHALAQAIALQWLQAEVGDVNE